MTELEGLQFQIEAVSGNTDTKLDSLAQAFTRLKTATAGWNGGSVANRLSEISSAVHGLSGDSLSGLERLTSVLSTLNGLGRISISSTIPKRISEIATASAQITEDSISRLERMGEAIQKLGSSGKIPRINLGTIRQGDSMGSDVSTPRNMDDTGEQASRLRVSFDTVKQAGVSFLQTVRELTTELFSFGKSAGSAGTALRGIAKYTVGLPITLGSGFARKIGEATASLGHMFSAIKRIALYRLIRTVIKEITQGLKEGINNIYAYSNALGGEFASAMDSLATSSLYLKNSLGAMAAPILQSLIPAINYAIDRIVALMNVINMFVSALGGKATATIAKRVQTVFNAAGSAASGAGGAAKKALKDLKSYTIGIDELNIIDPKDTSGSGGGSGGSGGTGSIDPASMFEEVDVDSGISDFANRIKQAFKSKDWVGLGTYLGEQFNGLIKQIPFDELGTKIGGKINGVVVTARNFLDTANFRELGGKFADFLGNALDEISADDLGATLTGTITSAIDVLIGFVETYPTDELATQVSDFIKGSFRKATEWINNHDWYDVGRTFRTKILDFFKGLDWEGMAKELGEFVSTGTNSASLFFAGLLGWTEDDSNSVDDFMNKVVNFFSNPLGLGSNKDPMTGYRKQKVYKNGIFSAPETHYYDDNGNEVFPFGGAGSSVDSSGFASSGGHVNRSFKVAVQITMDEWRSDIKKAFDEKIGTPVGKFSVAVKNTAMQWWNDVTSWWGGVVGNVQEFRTNVKNESSLWWSNLKGWWSQKVSEPVASFSTNVKNEASKWWGNVKRWWNGEVSTLDIVVAVKNQATEWWNNVKTWWDRAVGTLTAKLEIKLPKIEVDWVDKYLGSFKTKVPSFSLKWNAKGAILDGAQIFGAIGDRLLGGGEAGREAVLPLEQNTGWMDTIAEKVRDTMLNASAFEYAGVDRILDRLDAIEARLMSVDDNTRIQAEKPENTYVSIGGKAVRAAVTRQANADGYSFA